MCAGFEVPTSVKPGLTFFIKNFSTSLRGLFGFFFFFFFLSLPELSLQPVAPRHQKALSPVTLEAAVIKP